MRSSRSSHVCASGCEVLLRWRRSDLFLMRQNRSGIHSRAVESRAPFCVRVTALVPKSPLAVNAGTRWPPLDATCRVTAKAGMHWTRKFSIPCIRFLVSAFSSRMLFSHRITKKMTEIAAAYDTARKMFLVTLLSVRVIPDEAFVCSVIAQS